MLQGRRIKFVSVPFPHAYLDILSLLKPDPYPNVDGILHNVTAAVGIEVTPV